MPIVFYVRGCSEMFSRTYVQVSIGFLVSFENWYVICGVIPTGPLTNVQLTMITPGLVNPDVKYKLPIQPLQRVFHADAREDMGQVTLNLLLHGENEEAEVRGNEMSVKLLKNN